jgi:hypothetical protein
MHIKFYSCKDIHTSTGKEQVITQETHSHKDKEQIIMITTTRTTENSFLTKIEF